MQIIKCKHRGLFFKRWDTLGRPVWSEFKVEARRFTTSAIALSAVRMLSETLSVFDPGIERVKW